MTTTIKSTRTRRFLISLFLCAMVQASAPTPALAWFGWLDEWSGPGGWFGVLVDVRLVCFGPKLGLAAIQEQLEAAEAALIRSLIKVQQNGTRPEYEAEFREATRFFNDALRRLELAQLRAGVPTSDRQEVTGFRNNLRAAIVQFDQSFSLEQGEKPAGRTPAEAAAAIKGLMTTFSLFNSKKAEYFARITTNIEIQVGTGVFVSLCGTDNLRRASVEINANQWFTKDDQYNNNNLMWFSTIAPSISWKVASTAEHDFLDIGASAGVYTVRSKGMDAIAGFIIEPIRADFHGPTAWHSEKGLKKLASMVTVRVGLTMFPSGFEPGALKPTGGNTERIKPELIPTFGIFFKAMR